MVYRAAWVAVGGAGIFTGGFCAGSCASGLFTLRVWPGVVLVVASCPVCALHAVSEKKRYNYKND